MSHLYVGVLSVRPLDGERQVHKVHQVVVAVSEGFKVVICLNHLEYTCWDICIASNRHPLVLATERKDGPVGPVSL